ncbi:MAG TPA: NAD-dependent epimerase/dehydratase family protein [Ktedonobacteraceae bacterium]|nr:NAD-dependent epimerase/dehydratase family protein [Ktedonobacteraceae bacterium]
MLTRAFVTGGSGFVGRHLIAALHASGTEVRALARSEKAVNTVQDAGAIPVLSDLENKAFCLPGSPPLTRLAIQLMGEEVTVNDAKARRELGYEGHISREEGMASLRASFLSNASVLPNQEQEMSNR